MFSKCCQNLVLWLWHYAWDLGGTCAGGKSQYCYFFAGYPMDQAVYSEKNTHSCLYCTNSLCLCQSLDFLDLTLQHSKPVVYFIFKICFFIFIYKILYIYIIFKVCLWGHVHVSVSAHKGQRRASDAL